MRGGEDRKERQRHGWWRSGGEQEDRESHNQIRGVFSVADVVMSRETDAHMLCPRLSAPSRVLCGAWAAVEVAMAGLPQS